MTIKFGSVCSGIEAASVAFAPLGWEAAWLAEIEPFPAAVLAHHYPEVPNLGDMTTIPRRLLAGEIEAPDMLCGGTPCFTAGHMVITQRGYVPIEEIVVGDMVVTHKGRLRRVVRIGSKIARVGRLSGVGLGEKISCTPDHPFRSVEWRMQNTKRGNKYERVEHIGDPSWTAAKDMPGSQWCALTAVSVDAPVMPDGIDADELLYIAGFYLGDGFIRRWADANKKAVVFGVNDEKVDRFKARVTQSVSVLRERTGPRIVLGNTAIADWLIENFGEYSHAKTLPAWVLAHPQRAALMDGYRDTDGHCTANGWRAISVSRALAYGMRDLAQTLGMVASVAFTKVEPTKTIEGRKVNQRDYWTVTAFNGETSRKSRIRHGMLLRTVSAFEEVGDETVFNIEVDEDHSYVLDGVIVHNCQAFSVAGARAGLNDARGNLTLTYAELIDHADDVRSRRGRPPVVALYENVPGLLSDRTNAFGCLLAALAGEDEPIVVKKWPRAGVVDGGRRRVAWATLDAQYFGVAQRRRRVFVLAVPCELVERLGARADPAEILSIGQCLRGNTPTREGAGEGAAGGAAFSVALRGRDGGGTAELGDDLQNCLRASSGGGDKPHVLVPIAFGGNNTAGPIDVATARNACASASGRMDFESETFLVQPTIVHVTQDPCVSTDTDFALGRNNGGENVLAFDTTQITSAENRCNPQPGDPCHPLAAGAHPPAIAIQAGALRTNPASGPDGVGVQEDHAYTLEARSEVQCVQFAQQVRRLTPRECERLQGFPDDWTLIPWTEYQRIQKRATKHGVSYEAELRRRGKDLRGTPVSSCPDGPRYKALGNSWAVPCVRWIGRRIQAAITFKPTTERPAP